MNEQSIVAAVRLEFQTAKDVTEWVGSTRCRTWSRPPMRAVTGLQIVTPSGWKDAPYGVWVVGRADGTHDVLTAEDLALQLGDS